MRSVSRKRAGQALVEMALVITLLLGLMFAVFDFGRAFLCRMALNEAATLAVEYGTQVDNISGSTNYPTADQVAARARQALPGVIDPASISSLTVTTTASTNGWPAIKVAIAYDYKVSGPLLGVFYPNGRMAVQGGASHIYPQ